MPDQYNHINHRTNRPDENGFMVPQGYFERLKKHLLQHVQKIEPSSGLQDGFTVPDTYFENARARIIQQTIAGKPPRIISLWRNPNLLKYSAAAVLTGTLSIIFWLNNTTQKNAAAGVLTNNEIIYYLEQTDDAPAEITEVAIAPIDATTLPVTTLEENYLINQADEQLIIDQL